VSPDFACGLAVELPDFAVPSADDRDSASPELPLQSFGLMQAGIARQAGPAA
jgi:hypothetical protein